MRKREREIRDLGAMEAVIKKARVCRMALADGDRPYIVTLNFGYEDETLYFHSAPEGRKIDILRRNDRVCVAFDSDKELVENDRACGFTMHYRSVIGFGRASLIEDPAAKIRALDVIMRHYSDKRFTYDEGALEKVLIIKVKLDRWMLNA